MTTAYMIVTTYGPLQCGGLGHDTKTPGAIKNRNNISTSGGVTDFQNLLREAVKAYKLQRGDKIKVSIIPDTRNIRRKP